MDKLIAELRVIASDKAVSLEYRLTCEEAAAELERIPPEEDDQPEDGWIEWMGGKCPVSEGTLVWVKWRNGETTEIRAGNDDKLWLDDPDNPDLDVIAYRISD